MGSWVRKKTWHCGRYGKRAATIAVSYFTHNDRKAYGRKKKYQESRPAQKILNDKRAKQYLENLIHTNFGKGDLSVHLTYRNENLPQSIEEAQRIVKNYISRINRKRKKMNLGNARYIIITETGGKNGRIHHHLIMDADMDRDTVEDIWGMGYCNADRLRPDPKTGLADISAYIMKKPKSKKSKKDDERPKGGKRWISSTNLQKPWISINDEPREMSKKKFTALQDIPEDSEMAKEIIEKDNPGYRIIEMEKEYNQEYGKWYIYAKMMLKEKGKRASPRQKMRS